MRARDVMTKKRFRAWLRSLNPRKVVGRIWTESSPLDSYVKANGFPNAVVYGNCWESEAGRSLTFFPKWADMYQTSMLCLAITHLPAEPGQIITAKRALQLLDAA
ncbi:MAG: hypothetical protein WD187_03435 [Candidatus Woykebacteria bacterium]